MNSKGKVVASIPLDQESHKKLRMLAHETGLTNGEIICSLFQSLDMTYLKELLEPAVEAKMTSRNQKRKAHKEVEALSPERVRELLALLKK